MAWTGYVTLDADKTDVGTATAVWNEGQPDEFRYSRRARVSGQEANVFVVEAQAALVARDALAAEGSTRSGQLTALLNA
jgi:hypothetical protein